MDEIEVKLSPLDEDSKQALLSFVSALDEVRKSMDSIKTSFATDLLGLKDTLNRTAAAAAGGGMGGGGGGIAAQAANQILGPNGQPLTGSGQSSSSASRATASATTPGSGGSLGGTPNVDQGGHGGTIGGGGTNDPTMGYPYPSSVNSSNLPHNASWYAGDLQIPRINEFNIQDYTRMAGKVIAGGGPLGVGGRQFTEGGPLYRYKQNYEDSYNEMIDRGVPARDARDRAAQYAEAERSTMDRIRLGAAGGLAAIGKTGPYLAATENLMPQLLGGASGVFGAAGLAANMNAQMGISGSSAGLFKSAEAMPQALAMAVTQQRMGNNDESLYRFGSMLGAGRGFTDPRAIGLFSMQERGALAEASMEVNLRGGEFDTLKDRYTYRREAAMPALAPGQMAEMVKEQTRYGGVGADEAITNLNKLADAALTAGMNVKQMGEAAQAFHAANPQLTMAQSVEQATAYAEAGVNPAMASELINNPALAQSAYTIGMTPGMLPGLSPTQTLPLFGRQYRQMKQMYEAQFQHLPAEQRELAVQAMLGARGITGEMGNVLDNAEGYAALGEARENLGGSREEVIRNLQGVKIPGADGKLDKLTPDQIKRIANAQPKEGENLTVKGARAKALDEVFKQFYGLDARDPSGAKKKLEQMKKEFGEDDPRYQMLKEQVEGSGFEADAGTQKVQLELTGKAGQWFKIVENFIPSPGATAPGKPGPNIAPDFAPIDVVKGLFD